MRLATSTLRLHADEIVGSETAREFAMLGDGQKDLRRWHRDVEEKADWVLDSQLSQLEAQRNHMVVVHPDRVVRL